MFELFQKPVAGCIGPYYVENKNKYKRGIDSSGEYYKSNTGKIVRKIYPDFNAFDEGVSRINLKVGKIKYDFYKYSGEERDIEIYKTTKHGMYYWNSKADSPMIAKLKEALNQAIHDKKLLGSQKAHDLIQKLSHEIIELKWEKFA